MAHLALYRKYRPRELSDVVGQEHITQTLQNGLEGNNMSHAYLFTGPHGVGKTSVARILAYRLNKIEYSDETHLDIIEIDAASNRRIDEIRELRDKIHIAPTSAEYKVYIIDEVHMLTKEAFNALLKTLEEPPAHAIFILATTEAQKLPATIVSRTQRFQFKPVESSALSAHLKTIANKEKINIQDSALDIIAEHAEGSVRDGVSLLEQVSSSGEVVTPEIVEHSLGLAPSNFVSDVVEATISGDIKTLGNQLAQVRELSIQPASLSYQLINKLRGSPSPERLALIEKLLDTNNSEHPSISLETTLLSHAVSSSPAAPVIFAKTPETVAKKPPTALNIAPAKPIVEVKQAESKPTKKIEKTDIKTTDEPIKGENLNTDQWKQILTEIKDTNNSLYSVLRMATPKITDTTLHLSFGFPFHLKRATEERNKRLTESIAKKIIGRDVILIAEHVAGDTKTQTPDVFVRNGVTKNVESVIDVMGGGEVVEVP